jgi:hypothetical protein
VGQRVNWLEHCDILDQCAVPQEPQYNGHQGKEDKEHDKVVDELLAVAGI